MPGAQRALEAARALAAATYPPLISEPELVSLQTMIETVPPAAVHVLQHTPHKPFAVLGVENLAHAATLNTVNRRVILKSYRKLALQLHPDRCDHHMAVDAMQALNAAFELVQGKAGKRGG